MDDKTSNDFPATSGEPDAHGLAALLLVESLIHVLIEQSVITPDKAVEAVDVAVEVSSEMAADAGRASGSIARSLNLLTSIGASLRVDIPRE